MKKIYESPLNGWDDSAERVHVYALENDEEFWEIEGMNHIDRCDYFDVFDETGCHVLPGGVVHTYSFDISTKHVIVYETISLNV